MTTRRAFFTASFALFLVSTAQAQVVRTWVSVSGSDANSCSRNAPCRNFAAAIAAVDPGGEVVVLDSGGYGPFFIGQSVSIISPAGVHAAIAPTSGSAIVVSNAAARVVLRNLYLNSQGAQEGIDVLNVAVLHLEGVVVNGFSNRGMFFLTLTSSAKIHVKDSISRNNGTGLSAGTDFVEGFVDVSVDASRFENNTLHGVFVLDRGRVSLSDSVLAGNINAGAKVDAATGMTAELNAIRCSFTGNAYGVDVGTDQGPSASVAAVADSLISANNLQGVIARSGTARINGNLITRNGVGVNGQSTGIVQSTGDNAVYGNINNNTLGTAIVVVPPK